MNSSDINDLMKRVYAWQTANHTRWVKRSSGKIRFLKSTDWERGVFWSAVATAWQVTADADYHAGLMDYTLNTGFRPGPLPRFADDHVCMQAYHPLFNEINIDDVVSYSTRALDIMLDEPKAGRVDWWWCDSLFMAPPVFAAIAAHTGEQKYLDYMDTAWWDAVEHLYDPESRLFYRDARYIPDGQDSELREANGEKVFWSRGIGWVLAAIPRILATMPADYPSRDKYLAMFTDLAAEVIKYQHSDGFWRTSLLDPKSFPAPESSATALFCYGLAWGVRNGHLDSAQYMPIINNAWAALASAVHENGMIGWVQLPAFNPRDVAFEHNIDYGAGAFLLAGSEVLQLV